VKPAECGVEYQSFAAAREIDEVVRRLSALPGRVEYVAVDVTNPADVDRAVAGVVSKYGRIDLVMHGAGVQTSTRLENRKLDDFRRTIDTKIGGLRNIHAACRRHVFNDVHYHLLTSAFSYIGNDGQPDYGAANEAMNRLAQIQSVSGIGSYWTSLAWLAWDGIGMTRWQRIRRARHRARVARHHCRRRAFIVRDAHGWPANRGGEHFVDER
jgi:hypothetical protein